MFLKRVSLLQVWSLWKSFKLVRNLWNFNSFLLLSLTSLKILAKFNMKKFMEDVSVSKETQFNLEYYAENPTRFAKKIQNYRPE